LQDKWREMRAGGGATVAERLKAFSRVLTLIALEFPDSHDLNFSNRPVRTRMPGGVAGAQPHSCPTADFQMTQKS